MIRAYYKINQNDNFTGYFCNTMEMLRYEEEAIEDGDEIEMAVTL